MSLKVAFVLHTFPRLHNTFILNEIVGLLRLGVDVSILSLNRPSDAVVNDDVARLGLPDRTIYFDSFPDDRVAVPCSCEPFMAPFRRLSPARWRLLLHGQLKRPPRRFYPFEAVAERLVRDGYDLIHGGFGNRPATAAMILSEISGIPFTFETHAYDLFVDFPFAEAKIRRAGAVVTESQYHRAYLQQTHHAPLRKVRVIHLSPNRQMLEGLPDVERLPNAIVSVCRLHPIKGLSYGLQAVAKLKEEFPGLTYTIVGGGGLKGALKAEARRMRIHDIVRFVDDVSNEAACRIVRRSSVFLLPSVIAPDGDRDGTPTAIAEAMLLELPVVSSRISGIPELVDDGITGILTPAADVDEIAAALRRLLCDAELRLWMGRAGRLKVLEQFNIDRNAAALLDCWTDVLRAGTSDRAPGSLAASVRS
jgi:glycosyltransferase involved in cell wall biosynthesis